MHNRSLLEMHELERQYYIDLHNFYLDQAHKRIISNFEQLDDEFEVIAQENYDNLLENLDDTFNQEDLLEAISDHTQDQLMMLQDMREQVLLSIIANMFHNFDKNLRSWLEKESKFWAGPIVRKKIWEIDIGKIYDFFESLGWPLRKELFFKDLDACRLVVNVYKHGKGVALNDLRQKYPEYFFDFSLTNFYISDWYDHSSVSIDIVHLEKFSQAILLFWERIPRIFRDSEELKAPQWLEKALQSENN